MNAFVRFSRVPALLAMTALAAALTWNGAAFGQPPGRIGPGRSATRPNASAIPADTSKTPRPKPFDYSGWNGLLQKYVDHGVVRYAVWKKDGTKELDAVLAGMAQYPYTRLLGREDRLAFLLNAYNASVIRGILDAYPVASVKDIPGFFDRKQHAVGGGSWTLDDIEKKLIAGTYSDFPMRHFALVCGARGCPPLRGFQGDSLALSMNTQFQKFVVDTTRVQYDMNANVLRVSELFKWYGADFETGDQTIPRLVAPAFSLNAAMKIVQEEPRLEYIPFDWKLNDAEPSGGSR